MGHNTPAQGRMHDLSEGHGTAVSLLKCLSPLPQGRCGGDPIGIQ
jgi:hypothetical protein